MKYSTLFLFVLTTLFFGCDKCEGTLCFTPPSFFRFQFIDKDSGEDLLANGTYEYNDIEVTNLEDSSIVDFSKIAGEDYNFIEFNDIGWETEKVNYQIEIGEDISFNFYVDAERVNEDCCSFTRMNEVTITGVEYDEATSDHFLILINS